MKDQIETKDIIPGLAIERMTPVENLKPQSGILRGNDCFFPVAVEQLIIPSSGKVSPIKAIVNEHTGEQVGQYMREGSLVSNSSLVAQFEDGLKEAGYTFDADYTCYGEGARFVAKYTLTNVPLELENDGAHSLQLTLKNSYDGNWSISMGRMVERLICLNGMVSRVNELALCKKHSSRLELDKLAFNIRGTVAGAEEELKQFGNMRRYKLNRDQSFNFLANAVRYSKKALSKRLVSRIAISLVEGDDTDGEKGTLWELYNAGTRTFRDLGKLRPEATARANKAWSDICVLSANPGLSSFAKTAWNAMIAAPRNEDRILEV